MNTKNCHNAVAYFDNKNAKGTVKFHECVNSNGLVVVFDLYGLIPNKVSGIHIHEYGDPTFGCSSLGDHFDISGNPHGSIYVDVNRSHTGDLINNIKSDSYGVFKFRYFDPRLRISGDTSQSILGRSVVIHDNEDDLGLGNNEESKVTGNAGKRIAYALIGLAKKGAFE